VIDVDKAPIHIRKRLDLVLQVLGDVVSVPQRHSRRQDDVDLHEVLRSRVIYSARVDLEDLVRERHCLISAFDERLGLALYVTRFWYSVGAAMPARWVNCSAGQATATD